MEKIFYFLIVAFGIYNGINAEQNCFGVVCATSICPDGGPRGPYVNNCCSCDPKRFGFQQSDTACGSAVCAKDLCPDGKGRSTHNGDCCSCDPSRH